MVHRDKGSFLERNHLLIGVVCAIIALFIFSGWMMRRGVVAVRAEKVVRHQIASVISSNGKIETIQNFEAHAPGQLTVKRVFIREGDQVKAGQPLLQLDDTEIRSQASKALAQDRKSTRLNSSH